MTREGLRRIAAAHSSRPTWTGWLISPPVFLKPLPKQHNQALVAVAADAALQPQALNFVRQDTPDARSTMHSLDTLRRNTLISTYCSAEAPADSFLGLATVEQQGASGWLISMDSWRRYRPPTGKPIANTRRRRRASLRNSAQPVSSNAGEMMFLRAKSPTLPGR